MGVQWQVYVGPYAAYVVPAEFELPDETYDRLQAVDPTLDFHHNPPKVEVDGVPHERRFWTLYPRFGDAPGGPDRPAGFERGPTGDWELSAVDRAAEVRWFAAAFAPQLALLTAGYGRPPVLGWGVVSSAG